MKHGIEPYDSLYDLFMSFDANCSDFVDAPSTHVCKVEVDFNLAKVKMSSSPTPSDTNDFTFFKGSRRIEVTVLPNIHEAVYAGNLNAVKMMLIALPSLLEFTDTSGFTPLLSAAASQKEDIIDYLIEVGADIDAVSTCQHNIIDILQLNPYVCPKLLDSVLQKVSVTDFTLLNLFYSFEDLITQQHQIARQHNKKLLVILGECHGQYKIKQIQEVWLDILKRAGVNMLLAEIPDRDSSTYPIFVYAKNLGMDVIGVDSHPTRSSATLSERNAYILINIDIIHHDSVLITGTDHIADLMSNLNFNEFHVVPINMGSIVNKCCHTSEYLFAANPQNVIQATPHGLSKHEDVIAKWNSQFCTQSFTPYRHVIASRDRQSLPEQQYVLNVAPSLYG